MNKHLTLDYWMNKLGYRRTHWSDKPARELFECYKVVMATGKDITLSMSIPFENVTLSVKKMKK